jgi:isoleucyl-tRNA synthetase
VWRHIKFGKDGLESVHIAYFPEPGELTEGLTDGQRESAADWNGLLPVRDQVLKALDTAREDKLIGSSLEAAVFLRAGGDLYALLEKHAADLPAWFIVSQLQLERDASEELKVHIERARGDKCERCWKYTEDVGRDTDFPTVCASCASILREFWS